MSTEKSDYLLLFRNTTWLRERSPDEIQTTMTAWMDWFNGLIEDGRCKGGQSLAPEGKILSFTGNGVSDGPFTESKEAVAGYFLLHVAGLDEALEIARDCPGLPYGVTCEVRPLLARCKASELVREQQLAAGV